MCECNGIVGGSMRVWLHNESYRVLLNMKRMKIRIYMLSRPHLSHEFQRWQQKSPKSATQIDSSSSSSSSSTMIISSKTPNNTAPTLLSCLKSVHLKTGKKIWSPSHSLTHSPFIYVEGVKKMLAFRSLEIIISLLLLLLLLQHLLCVIFLPLILLRRLLLPPEKLSFSIFHQQRAFSG